MSRDPRSQHQHELNLASGDVGVRWQAEMEDLLDNVRTMTNEAMLHGIDPAQASLRAGLASANATAAIALAIANSDIANSIDDLVTALRDVGNGQIS